LRNAITEKAEDLALKRELGEIELQVIGNFTLADAIREGSQVTTQARDWGSVQTTACAMTAAAISARSRGYM
jgi:hypothetical protein